MKHVLPVALLVLIVVGVYLLVTNLFSEQITIDAPNRSIDVIDQSGSDTMPEDGATTTRIDVSTTTADDAVDTTLPSSSVLGQSVSGREIVAHHVGSGDTEILLVGGIHGGYSPNTTELVEELHAQYDAMGAPVGLRLTFIPLLNPDGAAMGSGAEGRFNARDVDLNRNFDCEWEETGMWRSQEVSGGTEPFSEPESKAIRDYVTTHNIAGAVVYYSAAGEVFPAECGESGVLPTTTELLDAYADAADYIAKETFDYYTVTGDMANWLAKRNIPTISVLLSNHSDMEFESNLAGVTAALGVLQ